MTYRDTIISMKKGGFTIVELLIVIVVIGILATIGVVTYGNAQDRARAGTVTEDISNIEDAFSLYGANEQLQFWPDETDLSTTPNPPINTIISDTDGFAKYLADIEPISGYPSSYYLYDNDMGADPYNPTDANEAFDDCGQTLDGVNLRIANVDMSLAQALDDSIDDGDLNCGQVRWLTSYNMIKYILSEDRILN